MSRGTWQGSGTWQSSGPDLSGLIGVAVLIGTAAAAAMVVLEFLWYIIAALAVLTAAAVAGLIWWKLKAQPKVAARYAAMYAAAGAAERSRRAELAPEKAPAIENHYHGPSIHIHGAGHEEAAALIRKALTEGERR